MKRKPYSEERIIYALKRVDAGQKAGEVCSGVWVSEPVYAWKRKCAGGGVPEVKESRALRHASNFTCDKSDVHAQDFLSYFKVYLIESVIC